MPNDNRRPNHVVNQNHEYETFFTNRVINNQKNYQSKKIVSDIIPKGIRIKEFNRFVKYGYTKIKH